MNVRSSKKLLASNTLRLINLHQLELKILPLPESLRAR